MSGRSDDYDVVDEGLNSSSYPGLDRNLKLAGKNVKEREEAESDFSLYDAAKENPYTAYVVGTATSLAVLGFDVLLREPDTLDWVREVLT